MIDFVTFLPNIDLNNVLVPGDVTIESDEDAYRYQVKIEESFQKQLGFRLKSGDMILTHFENLPNNNKKQGRRKSKVFERLANFLQKLFAEFWVVQDSQLWRDEPPDQAEVPESGWWELVCPSGGLEPVQQETELAQWTV